MFAEEPLKYGPVPIDLVGVTPVSRLQSRILREVTVERQSRPAARWKQTSRGRHNPQHHNNHSPQSRIDKNKEK